MVLPLSPGLERNKEEKTMWGSVTLGGIHKCLESKRHHRICIKEENGIRQWCKDSGGYYIKIGITVG